READHAISALAAHFVESGLPANSIVAVQLPNRVEFALTVLAAYRAGLVVAVLPLLWRQAELVAALNRTAARAIVTSSRVDGVGYADLAMNAAAEAFSIRHVCGFGKVLPVGMASLDRPRGSPSSTRLPGGTLALHHPFDSDVLEQQINEHKCDTLMAPAQLAMRLGELDLAARLPSLRNVIGLWRAPEQVASSPAWPAQSASLTDVYLFGEAGLFGARRSADGAPAPIMPGPHGARRELPGSPIAGDILLTPRGTLGLRGPMVTAAA